MTEKGRDRAIEVLKIIQKQYLEVKDIKDVSLHLKKMQDNCNLMHKFVKIEKVLLKIQIIFLFIILYLFFFLKYFYFKIIRFDSNAYNFNYNFHFNIKSKKNKRRSI